MADLPGLRSDVGGAADFHKPGRKAPREEDEDWEEEQTEEEEEDEEEDVNTHARNGGGERNDQQTSSASARCVSRTFDSHMRRCGTSFSWTSPSLPTRWGQRL